MNHQRSGLLDTAVVVLKLVSLIFQTVIGKGVRREHPVKDCFFQPDTSGLIGLESLLNQLSEGLCGLG